MPADSLYPSANSAVSVVIPTPLTVGPETLVEDAIACMHQAQSSYVLITDHQQRPIGIFTERDVVQLVAAGQSTVGVIMATVMTAGVRTLAINAIEDSFAIFRLMQHHRIRHLPVVDGIGQLTGVITRQSLRQALSPSCILKLRLVSEVMQTQVICAPREASLRQVVQQMAEHNVSCVVIVELQGPVGIITERDIVRFQTLDSDLHQTQVHQVMSTPLLPIRPQDSLWMAHQQMNQNRVQRLVVCASTGELSGLITQSNLLQVLNPAGIQQVVEHLQQQLNQTETDLQAAYVELGRSHIDLEAANENLTVTLNELQSIERQLIEKNQALEQARQQAEDEKKRYQDLFDSAPDGYLITDISGTIQVANQAAVAMLCPQQSSDFLSGLPLSLFINRSQLPFFKTCISQVKSPGQIHSFELSLKPLQQADAFPALIKISGISGLSGQSQSLGQVVGIRWLIQDITELKQAEQVLQQANANLENQVETCTADLRLVEKNWRTLLDNVHLLVVILDCTGKITYANPFFLTLTGYTAAELQDKDWFACFVPPLQQGLIKQYFQQLLSQSDTPLRYQNPILTRSGAERMIVWNNTLLHNNGDSVMGAMSIGEDITERFAIERMKEEFISVVSHELRTPLTSVHGGLKLLSQGIVPSQSEQGQELLQIVAKSSQQLVRLVNDILDIERLTSGKSPLQKQMLNTQDLTHQVVNSFQIIASEADIRLEVSDPGIQIVADGDRLSQVLTNLLDNAIKFSLANTTIQLTVEQQEEGADQTLATVLFAVRDQGRGIPPERCATIFERFMQVDSSDARQKGGTGLGLAICRNIIEQHGGNIWVESILGEGSCFYFTLPVEYERSTGNPQLGL